ncbi:MAG: aromatic ring-hydroxylating dioxygenase subunit alpha [Sphingomonadales bacterium]|nr:aromatic ring-hydroxylating dioxygenase subunit alpha [Sphingomonadales bacterium]
MADIDSRIELGLNPYPVTNPELIPAQRYYDEAYFKAESEAVWGHSWQMATRLERIPNLGDWTEYTILDKSVLVVNTKDGIKAFHNHCRHRGVPVAGGKGNEHGNCAKSGFICPFHGWRWNMDGDCTFVYGKQLFSQDLLEAEELKLRPVRCETFGGEAYINFDDSAPPLREWLGPIADALDARLMSDMRAEWHYGAVLPANWKIAMEAFQEGYHVMKTHPQLQHAQPSLYNARYGNDTGGLGPLINPNLDVKGNIAECIQSMELLSAGMAGLVHAKEVEIARKFADVDLPADPVQAMPMWYGIVQDAISKELKARGENVPDLNKVSQEHPVEALQFLFPNHFGLNYFTGMTTYRIRPLGPETCLFEIWSLTHMAPGTECPVPMEPIILPYDSKDFPQIPQQDYSNIPIQQRGLHSTGFEYMRLSKDREGLISNNHRVIDALIAKKPWDKITAATQKLAYNFDGPILELDL